MQKKTLLIPIIALLALYSPLVHAASPSPVPSPSPASIDEVTANLKERLQNSLQNLTGSPATPSATSYVGIVTDVVGGTVVLTDKDGKKDVKLNDDTVILRTPGNATIKSDDIRIDDTIIAIGYPVSDDAITGKRLVVSTTPFPDFGKTSGMGVIKTITKTTLTLALGDQDQVLSLTGKIVFKSPAGTIALADLALGDTVIYTAAIDDKNAQTATIIMRTAQSSLSQ